MDDDPKRIAAALAGENQLLRRMVARYQRRVEQLERKIAIIDKMQVAHELVSANLYRELEEQKRLIDEDLQQARAFQQAMLPLLPRSERFELAAVYEPPNLVGGDLYDVHEIPGGRLRIFIGDAIGHGIQASLRTMVVKAIYERLKNRQLEPSELLWLLNEELGSTYARLEICIAASCIDIDFAADPAGHTALVHYSNAGQPPLLRTRDGAFDEVYESGPYLGMITPASFSTTRFELAPGDRLYAYTDGFVEQWDDQGERVPEDELFTVLAAPGTLAEVIQAALARLREFRRGVAQADDLTLVGLLHHGPRGKALVR